MYGGKMVSESRVNQHKRLAGAEMKGNFGCDPFPCQDAKHPDASMSHAAMDDSSRGAPPAIGGSKTRHGMQAAPSHGPMGKDNFRRGGAL